MALPRYRRAELPPGYNAGKIGTELDTIARTIRPMAASVVRADGRVSVADDTLLCDAADGAVAVSLPDPGRPDIDGLRVSIKKVDSSTNVVTLVGVVDGVSNPTLSVVGESMTIQAGGGVWNLVGRVWWTGYAVGGLWTRVV